MTNDVKIFAKTIEQEATEQIEKLSHHPVSDGSKVRIMPDVHAGAGCTIGTTMTIHDRVCPNLVGVDIGCGMLAVKLGRVRLDLDELDKALECAGRVLHPQLPEGVVRPERPEMRRHRQQPCAPQHRDARRWQSLHRG